MKIPNLNTQLPKRTLLLIAAALLLLSFFSSWYFQEHPSVSREQRRLQQYVQAQQADFATTLDREDMVRRLLDRQPMEDEFSALTKKGYGIYLYNADDSGKLVYWNNQRALPDARLLAARDGAYFDSLPNGYYVVEKRSRKLANGKPYIAFAMIPVQYLFDYQHSDYLRTQFLHDPEAVYKIRIASGIRTPFVIRGIDTQPLFYIEARPFTVLQHMDALTAILRLLAFLLLLGYIHFMAEHITKTKGAIRGILFLGITLFAVRCLLLLAPGLFSLRQFELFNPAIYGNAFSWFSASLGDVLINAILFCWFVVFAWFHIGEVKRMPAFLYGNRLLAAGVGALFLLILVTFQYANIIRSLIADSKISFNVIDFFSLDRYTIAGFIVLALLSLSYYYFTRLLFRFIFPAFEGHTIYIYFILATVGLLYLSFSRNNAMVLFQINVLGWLVVYTLLLSQGSFLINRFRVTIAGALFWIFIFSISLAALILDVNKEKELNFRKAIAEKYDQITDPSGELTLNTALAYLDNDFLRENFPRFRNGRLNRLIRDSIGSANVSGYLNKYDSKIFIFDSLNQPVNNREPATYAELNNLFTAQSKPTGYPDLSYIETAYDQFTYITKRAIRDSSQLMGTMFIVSTPKRYNADALYPELFRRINETDAENSTLYSYAIYNKGLLVASSSKYPFRIYLTALDMPLENFKRVFTDDYDELWYRANSSKVVIIAKKRNTLLESITLFSYLFCAFLFLVGLIQLISFLLRAGNKGMTVWQFGQLSIRAQVHGTIIFISIFSFLVIGAATISFFISRYNRNNIDKLSRTAGIVVKEMQKRISVSSTFDDVIPIYDSVSNQNLQKLIDEVSDIHNVDVNVYDLEGNLQVSSEPEVYKRGLLSTKIHPNAFYELNLQRKVQFVQEESLSSLRYLSIYAAVRDENGQVYAYLNIPYFLSQIDVNQEISNFLVTIINLNAFIFLIAGIIALIITNRITRSFSLIGDKMKEIQVGRRNEEIIWPRRDEIGELVLQYNRMVQQLEQSADALAKSEREGAWREMARQVAHEIKNPLTPMKLSIQYLQRAVNANQPNVKELTTSVANTLVEQIDHLSKISSDFARFANIGNTNVEDFDLHQVLEGLVDLHKVNPKVKLLWNREARPLMLRADKTHMNRLFTNLFTNAIEACGGRECLLTLTEHLEDDRVVIELADNGEGIPEEMQAKIFTPNFTTKSSGTGLGLAMCKSIAEQAGGRIWFETELSKGTRFFVELPLLS